MKVGVICMKVKVKIHRFIRPEQKESLKVKEGLKVKGGVHRHGICQKKLHRRIFSLKNLHRQFHLISTVLIRKNTQNE